MKRYLISLCLVGLASSAAWAQQKKNAGSPPKPDNNGPSLEVTMKFIQEKTSAEGRDSFAAYGHDDATGQDWTHQISDEITNVVASPERCQIQYHFYMSENGQTIINREMGFNLKDVQTVVVMTREEKFHRGEVADGHPTWKTTLDPQTWLVEAVEQGGGPDLVFHDEDMANRVAKAMTHAVQLCGGGKAEPF